MLVRGGAPDTPDSVLVDETIYDEPLEPPEDDNKSYMVLGVLGALVIGGGAVYLMTRKKKKKKRLSSTQISVGRRTLFSTKRALCPCLRPLDRRICGLRDLGLVILYTRLRTGEIWQVWENSTT